MNKPIIESTVLTSNIVLDKKNINLEYLKTRFKLVKYSTTTYKKFENIYKKMPTKPDVYIQSIIAFKEQIDYPFYFLVRDFPHPTFYVLVPIGESPKNITLNNFTESISCKEIPIEDLLQSDKINVLLRLLLASYFWEVEKDVNRLICQSRFYVYAQNKKKHKNRKGVTTTHLSLAHTKNVHEDLEEYTIDIEAKNFESFINPNKESASKEPFFEDVVVEGTNYLRQIRPQQVSSLKDTQLWRLASSKDDRASLDWFTTNEDKQSRTRSKIAFDFQKKFVNYVCQQIGENSLRRQEITMKRIGLSKRSVQEQGYNEQNLPVYLLKKIGVLDNRTQQANTCLNGNQIDKFVEFLNKEFATKYKIEFENVTLEMASQTGFSLPLLIVHDAPKKAFELHGLLHSNFIEDPKPVCYQKLPHLIKQSVDVNPNSETIEDFEVTQLKEFFDYDFFSEEKKDFLIMKLEISLSELVLKMFIKNNQVCDLLPLFANPNLHRFCFQKDNTFLYIDDDRRLQIIDIATQEGKKHKLEILKARNLDWSSIESYFRSQLSSLPYDKVETRLRDKAFIFTDDVCMEIEENTSYGIERVLPNYDEGANRSILRLASGMAGGVWWHSESGRYAVGLSESLHRKETNANLVRKIIRYPVGNKDIKIDETLLMQTMCVQFVKYKQFTTYPYFFDLIRLFKEV